MENKTLSYLNSRVWYRLVKVAYILLFIFVLVSFNLFVIATGIKRVDLDKTRIQCSYKDKKEFSPKNINLDLKRTDFVDDQFYYRNFFGEINEYEIKNILKECYDAPTIRNIDIFALQRTYEITGTKEAQKEYDKSYLSSELDKIVKGYKTNQEKMSYLDFSINLFEIRPAFNYTTFARDFLLGNLTITLIFELFRRIFYYISLGKLNPRVRND